MKIQSFTLILAASIIQLFSNCKKQDSDKLFDSDSRIRGIVLFDNVADGKRDTATAVEIRLYRQSAPNTIYQVSVTDGRFDLKGLANDQFTLEGITTVAGNITYAGSQKFDLSKGMFLDLQELVLKSISVRSPTLALQILDDNGGPVKDAKIGLYTDPAIIDRNPFSTTGSVSTGTTNSNGILLISGLQAIRYYADVYLSVGNDTLSNAGHTSDVIGPLNAATLTSKTITIGITSPSLSVTVVDASNAYIGSAAVRLYSDKALLLKYGNDGTGTGSLRSGTSSSFGKVRFDHLQPISYYVSVRKIIGKDTLSNKATEASTILMLLPGNNSVTVTVE